MSQDIRGQEYYPSSRPWTRWWWFYGPISEREIRYQLDWLKANGFGGVEVAWVYPQRGAKQGPEFLSGEWTRLVAFTKQYCEGVGLGCDFTFGTMWPFGGAFVDAKDASKTFHGLSEQRLRGSWEEGDKRGQGYIIDHMNRDALARYAGKIGSALKPAMEGDRSALFCDSWEVETEGLWTGDFEEIFRERNGYSIAEHMDDLDEQPHIRYDYRKLVAELVLDRFYRPFTTICKHLGGFSRVQCHGSPTDLLAAYGAVDVETFTSLYGWKPRPGPAPYIKEERTGDMKLLVDALFASGVNHIFWHGMPYNPKGGSNEFYTTVHVGPDAAFAGDLGRFNDYMRKVSSFMRKGRTYTDVAALLPIEDAWMKNELPAGEYPPGAKYQWEFRYHKMPAELGGRHPLWISGHYLKRAEFERGRLRIGDAEFSILYVDMKWLDEETLDQLLRLGAKGMPLVLIQQPQRPGKTVTHAYSAKLNLLNNMPGVYHEFQQARIFSDTEDGTVPLGPSLVSRSFHAGAIVGSLPDDVETSPIKYWCRKSGNSHIFFFAHPKCSEVTYPMEPGQSHTTETFTIPVEINTGDAEVDVELVFRPYQSLLLEITGTEKPVFHDIEFVPSAHRGG